MDSTPSIPYGRSADTQVEPELRVTLRYIEALEEVLDASRHLFDGDDSVTQMERWEDALDAAIAIREASNA